jgi:tRNA-splicing endonuclease subunit Sen2
MAEIPTSAPVNGQAPMQHAMTNGKPKNPAKQGSTLHQIYALPAPIRTFPLPTFYPNNPVSLFHVAYAWLQQVFRPPPYEPSVVHHGVWSPETTSVHVTDEKSMRALWEQGFYGKGSLSRSEPNWLKREEVRRGIRQGHVSEILTLQRREDRAQAKWERARLEQEVIRQTRLREAQASVPSVSGTVPEIAAPVPTFRAPVGPLELLALPNSDVPVKAPTPISFVVAAATAAAAPVGPLELLALPNSAVELAAREKLLSSANNDILLDEASSNGTHAPFASRVVDCSDPKIPGLSLFGLPLDINISQAGVTQEADTAPARPVAEKQNSSDSLSPSSDSNSDPAVKRRKSVRFSPTVESTTFEAQDPPSPRHTAFLMKGAKSRPVNGHAKSSEQDVPAVSLADDTANVPVIVNKEHLQLMPEEAFFLAFGLGALTVNDAVAGKPLSTTDMFRLFRQYSYFPPRIEADDPHLQPDDAFLVNYAVYHHFRSLGWTPRAGIKFGVDWLLYTRGPVFDHAEFGLMVIPSYTDPLWAGSGKKQAKKTWQWMHSIVRVLAHVTKSLVLVYVDIPPPSKFDAALEKGFVEAFKQYKVREVMVKRWSSNRNR